MIRKILVWITLKIGLYKWAVDVGTRFMQRKMRKAFLKYGLETLQQADKAFRSVGAKLFLDFGTLLGAYRDKKFIPYDFDLDVGCLYDAIPENIPDVMEAYGFKHKKQVYLKEMGLIVEDVYIYKGVQMDIFYYFKKNTDLYCYLARRHETKPPEKANSSDGFPCKLSWVDATEFSEYEFLGHKFFMPDNTPKWLEDIYGASYMTPQKKWSEFAQPTRIKPHNERVYRRYF